MMIYGGAGSVIDIFKFNVPARDAPALGEIVRDHVGILGITLV
jgi:hypothetical protein